MNHPFASEPVEDNKGAWKFEQFSDGDRYFGTILQKP